VLTYLRSLFIFVVYFRCLFALGAVQAAGGPQSDYAVVSLVRERGTVTVRFVFVCVRLCSFNDNFNSCESCFALQRRFRFFASVVPERPAGTHARR
jgi:hypothetical protein